MESLGAYRLNLNEFRASLASWRLHSCLYSTEERQTETERQRETGRDRKIETETGIERQRQRQRLGETERSRDIQHTLDTFQNSSFVNG